MSHFNVIDRKFIYWTQSCQIFNIVHVTFERKLKSIFEWVWNVCVAGIVVMTFSNLLLGTWKENIAYRFLMKILIESIFVCIHKRERKTTAEEEEKYEFCRLAGDIHTNSIKSRKFSFLDAWWMLSLNKMSGF